MAPSLAHAQAEDPDITEARTVILGFCQAFLDGDADHAIDQIDSRAAEYQGYVRMIPILTSMTYAENQLFDTVDEHFGTQADETYRSSNTITTLPYSIIQGIDDLDIVIEDDIALLQYPIEGEEPMNILLLNRVGDGWKIDASESLGMPLPENEQHWAAWQSNAQLFISHINELREEVPSFDTPEEYNERFMEHMQALQADAEEDGS